ncbi:hypothetical protein A9Q83_04195 [Alphaproteobacteria bacterium 46_93_T64]|nr:hypothetical protein A9Q83_04195 [Alphaproteobacteria bacterium 46_93_T64]
MTNGIGIKREFLRKFASLDNMKDCIFFRKNLKPATRGGEFFAAFRENKLDFYFAGSRPFSRNSKSYRMNDAYFPSKGEASPKSGEILVPADDIDRNFIAIKQRCQLKGKASRENFQISKLFRNFSAIANKFDGKKPLLIDVEATFYSLDHEEGRRSDRIDLVFLMPNKKLFFVEVKRRRDSRVRSAIGKPEVISQVGKYNAQLKCRENQIVKAYKNSISLVNELFDTQIPMPEGVVRPVALLIVDDPGDMPMDNQKSTKNGDIWLQPALNELNGKNKIWTKSSTLCVDGRFHFSESSNEVSSGFGSLLCEAASWNMP